MVAKKVGKAAGQSTPRKPRSKSNSPTKAQIKQLLKDKKAARELLWARWCRDHKWTKDPSYSQKDGAREIHKTDAKTHFRLEDYEMDTLPYWEFPIEYKGKKSFGKSYLLREVEKLMYRKHAMLDPDVELPLSPVSSPQYAQEEKQFLTRGKALADTHLAKLAARAKGKAREPTTWTIIKKPSSSCDQLSKPFGSWWTPAYENGVKVGSYLNLQFDPLAGDDDFYEQFDRPRFVPPGQEY